MRLILATILILALVPGAAAAQAVETGPAEAVDHSTATLTGTVDPNGGPHEYHFEYGTTTPYGSQTTPATTAPGESDVSSKRDRARSVDDLPLPARDGRRRGRRPHVHDRSQSRLRRASRGCARPTGRRPRPRDGADQPEPRRDDVARRVGAVDELRQPHAGAVAARGDGAVPVSLVLDGLPSYRGSTGASSPRTPPACAAAAARASRRCARRAASRSACPRRSRRGAARSRSPGRSTAQASTASRSRCSSPRSRSPPASTRSRRRAATATACSASRSARVFLATRYPRRAARSRRSCSASVRSARVRSRVRIHRGRKTRRAVWLAGRRQPGPADGARDAPAPHAVRLEERRAAQALTQLSEVRSTYEFKVRRRKRRAVYRVRVAARDGGAHARGYSRKIGVGKKTAEAPPRLIGRRGSVRGEEKARWRTRARGPRGGASAVAAS